MDQDSALQLEARDRTPNDEIRSFGVFGPRVPVSIICDLTVRSVKPMCHRFDPDRSHWGRSSKVEQWNSWSQKPIHDKEMIDTAS